MNCLAALRQTIAAALRDQGMILFFLFGVPAYSFFYPLPYTTEVLRHVPLEVVDLDASPLSRQIRRDLAAVPAIRYVGDAASIAEASPRLATGKIAGIVVISQDFQRDVLRTTPTAVTVFGSGAYPVQDKAVLESVTLVVQNIANRAGIQRMIGEGASPTTVMQALASRPAYIEQPLYNLARGYGSYAVVAVSILIVQQMMLIGIAALIGTWREARAGPLFGTAGLTLPAFAGTATSFAGFALVAFLYMIGFAYWFQDYPRGGNFAGALAFALLTATTIAFLGMALGAWIGNRERAIQVLIATSIPFLFMSGAIFPREAMPLAVNALAALIPTTAAISGFVKFNQMGASWSEAHAEISHMLLLLVLYGAVAWLALRYRNRSVQPPASLGLSLSPDD